MKDLNEDTNTDVGSSPGTLTYTGEDIQEPVSLSVIDFTEEDLSEKTVDRPEECFEYRDKDTTTWININGLHNTDIVASVGEHYSIHPLIQEDIVNVEQRPKFDDIDGYLFIQMKMLRFENEIVADQLSLIVTENNVITFQEAGADVFEPVRKRLRNGKGRIRTQGSDYLAYALMDAVVDNYFAVLESIGEEIEEIEDELLEDPDEKHLEEIYRLKRELISARKSVWPMREVISKLERSDSELIDETTHIYIRDVYEHTIQAIDMVETYRDTVSGIRDLYLSSLSNRMNEVMKVLTIIATIFIPLTFIAGVYGMNFANMPELTHPYGYPIALAAMAIIAIVEVVYFGKKGWL